MRPLNPKEYVYAHMVANGVPKTTAVVEAGWSSNPATAEHQVYLLNKREHVNAKITELLADRVNKAPKMLDRLEEVISNDAVSPSVTVQALKTWFDVTSFKGDNKPERQSNSIKINKLINNVSKR